MQNTVIHLENVDRKFYVSKCDTIFDYLKGKSFRKKKEIVAVENINFDIAKGEFVGLLGVNGAGKSTLIKMMTGILLPSSGKVTVLGNDPFKERIKNNYRIAAVFGQRCQLRWDISPMESYRLFQAMYKIPEETYQQRLKELVDILEVGDTINQPVRTLSLGQKMRAELVGALLHNPELLFLDEPTLGLDVLSKDAIIKFLIHCKKQNDTTVIFTTHDMEAVQQLCERVIIVNHGKMVMDDKTENLSNYTKLNTVIKFKINKEKVRIPEQIKALSHKIEENEIIFDNVEETEVVKVISSMFEANQVYEVDVKKPEFKDLFMNLFQGDIVNESI